MRLCTGCEAGVLAGRNQLCSVLWYTFELGAGFDELFVTVKIVIEKLMEKSLHGSETIMTRWLPPSAAGRGWR